MSNKKLAIILRGIPGAGKSTYIKEHFPQAVVCSADHFFINKAGEYKFDHTLLGYAHDQCKYRFRRALEEGVKMVAVDNTNRTVSEMRPYVDLANEHDYDILVVRLEVDPKVAFERGIHGVPEDKVHSMSEGMVMDLPEGWSEMVVKQ